MRTFFQKLLQVLDGTPASYGRERQRGQSFVEMIFITPILIIMVAGIMEIGWYANNYINLLEAAKVGARRGPFLTGDNAPQIYETQFMADNNGDKTADSTSVVHPLIASGNIPALPKPGSQTDPVLQNPRYATRGYTYPMSLTECTNIPPGDFGFFNIVACTALDSLDPLQIRIDVPDRKETPLANGTYELYKDDIVISVFSLQKINNGVKGQINADGYDGNEDGIAEGTPYDFDINAISEVDYPSGHQVIVVGRWPSEANECYDGTNSLEGVNRDPFDYITNRGFVDEANVIIDDKPVRLAYEWSTPVFNERGEIVRFAPFADTGVERQRGWVLTGQRPITPETAFSGDCFGSDFSLQEVQELMNLPRFVEDNNTNYQNRRRYLPSQGIVLVEIFWEHDLLLGDVVPLFYGAYDLFLNLGGRGEAYDEDRNIIHVWAAFPAPAAEPNLIYP